VDVPAGATASEQPVPRLLVADAASGDLELIDVATGDVTTTFEGDGPVGLVTTDASSTREPRTTNASSRWSTGAPTGSWPASWATTRSRSSSPPPQRPATWSFPAEAVAMAITPDGATVVALTVDGHLHGIDTRTATVTSSIALTGAVDTADDDAPEPGIAIAGSRAYVSDPAARTVLEVDLGDALRLARTFATGVRPGPVVVTGAP
jgi:hypothetical protein